MRDSITLRSARMCDVAAIEELINGYAAERLMLPRTAESIELALDDFVVVTDAHGHILACGALKMYSPSLAEVASVAVARDMHGRGLGSMVVTGVEQLAHARGVAELFAITLTPQFFESLGYERSDRSLYPEKLRRDCATCPRMYGCPEACTRRDMGGTELRAAA
jgi:amino-acid N-acetyltransferase